MAFEKFTVEMYTQWVTNRLSELKSQETLDTKEIAKLEKWISKKHKAFD